jgi:NAD(P)H-dependent FMN reductase
VLTAFRATGAVLARQQLRAVLAFLDMPTLPQP